MNKRAGGTAITAGRHVLTDLSNGDNAAAIRSALDTETCLLHTKAEDRSNGQGRLPPMNIALIGTRGVPAQYGGFETAVEEVGSRLVERGHEVVVYCRGNTKRPPVHRGMQLVHLPAIHIRSLETLSHSLVSTVHQVVARRSARSVAIVLNAANAPFVPILRARGIPTALHVDGLEWKRAKWGPNGRRYYLACERLGVRVADALIADARAIQTYYRETYGAPSVFIPYGAPVPDPAPMQRLGAELGVSDRRYHLVVARMEPENHVLNIVRGYANVDTEFPLIVVGSAPYAGEYQRKVEEAAREDGRVRLIGPVWDQSLLDALYTHCASYLHGHSVGGTNPSLLRAMGAGAPVVAVDVCFNREVLGDTALYFYPPRTLDDPVVLPNLSSVPPDLGYRGRMRGRALYDWDVVAQQYEDLCRALLTATHPGRLVRKLAGWPSRTDVGLLSFPRPHRDHS